MASLSDLIIETATTEEYAVEGMESALDMEVGEERDSKVSEEGGGTQQALEALEFLTQEAEPSGTTIVDACNGFNKLICFAVLWTVQHC